MKFILLVTLLISLNVYSKTAGFKIASIKPGSSLSQLNLQSGDIIQKINNKDINSLNDLMTYMGNPKSVKSIKFLRNNKEKNVEINIE
ncbi:MAG: PDZ domain-containing protein [Bacteriovorax sp.]|nr:PDZ domain-containing protein [Bacteriovorax sp.]